jgi:hypothetical protein
MTLYKTERVATNKNFGIGGLPAEYLKIKMFLKNALNLKAKQNMYVYSILNYNYIQLLLITTEINYDCRINTQ